LREWVLGGATDWSLDSERLMSPKVRIPTIVPRANNRGYGGSGGSPTEENNVADAIAAYDHLIVGTVGK
jgi:hypothetical protein